MSKRAFPLLPLLSLAVVLTAAILPAFASRVPARGLCGVPPPAPLRGAAGAPPPAPPQRIDLVRRGMTQDDSGIIFVVQQPPEKEQQTALTDARAALQTLVDYGVLPADFPAASCEYSYTPPSRLLFRDRSTGESVSVYVMQMTCDAGSIDVTMDVETKAVYELSFSRPPTEQELEEGLFDKVLIDSTDMAASFSKQLGIPLSLDPEGASYGYEYYQVAGTNSCYSFHSVSHSIDVMLNDRPTFFVDRARTTRYGDEAVSVRDN